MRNQKGFIEILFVVIVLLITTTTIFLYTKGFFSKSFLTKNKLNVSKLECPLLPGGFVGRIVDLNPFIFEVLDYSLQEENDNLSNLEYVNIPGGFLYYSESTPQEFKNISLESGNLISGRWGVVLNEFVSDVFEDISKVPNVEKFCTPEDKLKNIKRDSPIIVALSKTEGFGDTLFIRKDESYFYRDYYTNEVLPRNIDNKKVHELKEKITKLDLDKYKSGYKYQTNANLILINDTEAKVISFSVDNLFNPPADLTKIVTDLTNLREEILENSKYKLKVHSKYEINKWLSADPPNSYTREVRSEILKRDYPNIYKEVLKKHEGMYVFYKYEGKYYYLWLINSNGSLYSDGDELKIYEGKYSGYSLWKDQEIRLRDISNDSIEIDKSVMDRNGLKVWLEKDNYYLDEDSFYVLDVVRF